MATNKNAQLRYQILDRCFSNFHKRYEIDDLLDEVNEHLLDIFGTTVSTRQIREDIKYMRDRVSFNAPIVAYPYDGKKCYYRYSDSNFSIYNNELSVADLNKLQSTIDMLARFRGTAANIWLEEVISNLEYRFGLKSNTEHLVSFEQNEQLKGFEYLADIIDATTNHQALEIVYLTFRGKEIQMTIHPYYIKQLKFPTPVFIMFQSNNGCCNPSVFRRFLFVKNTLIPALLLIQVLPRLGVC